MAADRTRVLARVTEILNLCDPGTYSSTLSTRNKTRNAGAIADFVDEAGMRILEAIAKRPNEFRYLFAATSSEITTRPLPLPPHLGPLMAVRITPYNGSTTILEGDRRDRLKIQSYIDNPHKLYGAIDHNMSSAGVTSSYDVTLAGGIAMHNEVPVGDVDGVNMEFELEREPRDGVIVFSVNGVVRAAPADYSISGTTITMAFAPAIGSDLWVTYMSVDAEAEIVETSGATYSSLAGYYDVWEDEFWFTGHSSIVRYVRVPVRADVTSGGLIPDIFESTWIRLAVGEAAKVGAGGYEAGIIGNYGQKGQADLEDFKNGTRQFLEVDDPKPQSAVHAVV